MTDAPKKPKRPVEEVRAELMASEETKQLAKTLGIGLEDYVEKVLAYYAEPSKQPQIYLAPEEQLRAAGYEPPTEKEILSYLQKVESGEIDLRPEHMKDNYNQAAKPKVAGLGHTSGSHPMPEGLSGEKPATSQGGSALRDQVQKQVRKDHTSKG